MFSMECHSGVLTFEKKRATSVFGQHVVRHPTQQHHCYNTRRLRPTTALHLHGDITIFTAHHHVQPTTRNAVRSSHAGPSGQLYTRANATVPTIDCRSATTTTTNCGGRSGRPCCTLGTASSYFGNSRSSGIHPTTTTKSRPANFAHSCLLGSNGGTNLVGWYVVENESIIVCFACVSFLFFPTK
jgi:hypothetical protein